MATAPRPGRMSRADEIAFAGFVSWAILGLFLDGWSHRHDKPESFASPWHGMLYSGIGLAIAWFAIMAPLRNGRSPRSVDDAVPGSRLTALGLVMLALGGTGDFAWHAAFGIEADVDALLSPTHLFLMLGGVFALAGPLHDAWKHDPVDRPTLRDFAPLLAAIVTMTALISFFFMYASAFTDTTLTSTAPAVGGADAIETWEVAAFMGVMVTTALLLGPVLIARRRWTLPRYATAAMVLGPALFMGVLDNFEHWLLIVPAVLAAGVAEAVAPRNLRAFSIVTPLVFWAAWFPIAALEFEPMWHAELIGAALVLAPLFGAGLGLLGFPPAAPTPAPRPEVVEAAATPEPAR